MFLILLFNRYIGILQYYDVAYIETNKPLIIN